MSKVNFNKKYYVIRLMYNVKYRTVTNPMENIRSYDLFNFMLNY